MLFIIVIYYHVVSSYKDDITNTQIVKVIDFCICIYFDNYKNGYFENTPVVHCKEIQVT